MGKIGVEMMGGWERLVVTDRWHFTSDHYMWN